MALNSKDERADRLARELAAERARASRRRSPLRSANDSSDCGEPCRASDVGKRSGGLPSEAPIGRSWILAPPRRSWARPGWLDTSALTAILLGEPERDRFLAKLADADDPVISAATLVEASIVMQAKLGDDGVTDLDELLAAAAARCVVVDVAQAVLARDAFARLGKGRAPPGAELRRLLLLRAREGCRTAAPVQGIRLQPH